MTWIGVVHGSISFPTCELAPGDVVLLRTGDQSLGVYEDTVYVQLDWVLPNELTTPSKLSPAPTSELERIADAFDDVDTDDRALFARAMAIGRARGVSFGDLDVERLTDSPSERDIRLCRALEAQLAAIGSRADTEHVSQIADLSPRQLQRVLSDFAARYGLPMSSWRELRNRWRVQLAVTLLTRADLKVADVAAEVGYASAAALTRALATAGFPSPSEIRAAPSSRS